MVAAYNYIATNLTKIITNEKYLQFILSLKGDMMTLVSWSDYPINSLCNLKPKFS